ncbi:MAG: wax ester/triacylglycerol synthase family O-acyltransferase [Deltaproteobacteria bacterium]|jgi:diacylglycerol O-acyltransferase|nr:wax ester/triacylglycerol synthase family O-acyltransferase [Deltaproteobacteria bacterium]
MPNDQPFFERLSTLDQAFLATESESCPMHVGAVLVLDAKPLRTASGGVDFDAILAFIAGALHSEPRFTQRLHRLPVVGEHVWVDDPHFSLEYHVRHAALPQPGDERQLKRLAGRIFSQNLDRSRPLWEFWVVEGLEGDRFAMICKVHHCLTDGMGAVSILKSMVGTHARPERPRTPRPMPSDASLLRSSLARRMTSLDRVRLTVLRLRGAGEGAAQRSPLGGLIETLKKVVAPGPVTSLNPHQVGPHRRFDTLRMDLEELKEVKERLGGKLNDVVLTTVALGLGRFFRELGERPEDYAGFRALVPASVRGTDSGSARGNQVATLIATLPIAVCDPLEAYACVCDETRFLKTESNAVRGIQLLEDLDDALGLGAVSSAFVLAGKLRSFNTIVTNVPGPPVPVPLFGAPLLEIYGLVPLFAQQALGIALFSYAGQLHWGFNADWEHVGGLHLLVDGMRDAFADLLRAARAHPQA